MRKIKENGIIDIIHTNFCIILMILVVLILTIVYKYITYKKEVQAALETSVNIEELYNTTKAKEARNKLKKEIIQVEKILTKDISKKDLETFITIMQKMSFNLCQEEKEEN